MTAPDHAPVDAALAAYVQQVGATVAQNAQQLAAAQAQLSALQTATATSSAQSAATIAQLQTQIAALQAGPKPAPKRIEPSDKHPVITLASLWKTGDNIATAIARMTSFAQVIAEPGLYEVADGFAQGAAAYMIYSDFLVGFIGDCDDPHELVIRMAKDKSGSAGRVPTAKNTTNPLSLFRIGCGTKHPEMSDTRVGNFHLEGTDQGHNYHGLNCYYPAPGAEWGNFLVSGIPGSGNSNPNETFGLSIQNTQGAGGAKRIALHDLEVTGIRASDGARVGASPIGWNNAHGVDAIDAYAHDGNVGMPTFWQSSDCTTTRLRSEYNGYGSNDTGINHEESTGITHNQPRILTAVAGRAKSHIAVASQLTDCAVTVIGATFDGLKLNVEIDATYGTGQKVTGKLVTVDGVPVR